MPVSNSRYFGKSNKLTELESSKTNHRTCTRSMRSLSCKFLLQITCIDLLGHRCRNSQLQEKTRLINTFLQHNNRRE